MAEQKEKGPDLDNELLRMINDLRSTTQKRYKEITDWQKDASNWRREVMADRAADRKKIDRIAENTQAIVDLMNETKHAAHLLCRVADSIRFVAKYILLPVAFLLIASNFIFGTPALPVWFMKLKMFMGVL